MEGKEVEKEVREKRRVIIIRNKNAWADRGQMRQANLQMERQACSTKIPLFFTSVLMKKQK